MKKQKMKKQKTNHISSVPINGYVKNDDVISNFDRKQKVEHHVSGILDALGFDWKHDSNSKDTPRRVAKMFCDELLIGSYSDPPVITSFETKRKWDQLIFTGPIPVKSMCAHHWMPIKGTAYIGIYPNQRTRKFIGLSKYARIVEYFSRRFQLQEELTAQIADFIEETTNPAAVAVYIVAEHMCCTHRGANTPTSNMHTNIMRGKFLTEDKMHREFMQAFNIAVMKHSSSGQV